MKQSDVVSLIDLVLQSLVAFVSLGRGHQEQVQGRPLNDGTLGKNSGVYRGSEDRGHASRVVLCVLDSDGLPVACPLTE